jgi:hypothetical protein
MTHRHADDSLYAKHRTQSHTRNKSLIGATRRLLSQMVRSVVVSCSKRLSQRLKAHVRIELITHTIRIYGL